MKIMTALENKGEIQDVQNIINNFVSDQTKQAFALKEELFSKITELYNLMK